MTSSENLLKIETHDYDLNTLFNFQSNFDQLKFVLTALARSQKKVLDRVHNIEKSVNITNVDSNGFVLRGDNLNIDLNFNNQANDDDNKNDGNGEVEKVSNKNNSGEESSQDFLIVINFIF